MQKLRLLAGAFLTAVCLLPALCSGQTVLIVSGNGQLVCPNCPGATPYTPLVVQVKDVTGAPVVNATVTWTATQGSYGSVVSTSPTNSSGQATYIFQPYAFFFGSNVLPATITASALGASVLFNETTALPGALGLSDIFVELLPSGEGEPNLTGPVGSTATPLQVTVVGPFGALQGVQLAIKSGATGQPNVSCQTQPGQPAGTVLTNSSGTGTCVPVFGGTIGKGSYTLVVGGNFESFGSATVTVTAGPPAMFTNIKGDKQSVNLGSVTPLPLSAEVTDLGGNPSAAAQVTWTVTSGTATLTNKVTASTSAGIVSVDVTPTALPSPVQVTLTLTSKPTVIYVFTVNVNTVVTSLQAISTATEAAKVGQAFPDPLIVQVNDNSTPVPGATVSFSVTPSGSVTLSGAQATNASGQTQVTATAGETPGPAVVTASIVSAGKTYSVTFNLTVNPLGPVITGIFNAAGFQSQFVSPCSLAYVTGSGFADTIQGVAEAFIGPQTQVANVTVSFTLPDGSTELAPILDVANQNGQESLGIQIPCEVAAGNPPAVVPMVVSASGSPSAPFNVNVSTYSPGIFQSNDPADGVLRAVLIRPNGSFVSTQNPAQPGETIRMFVTGLGQTNPALFTDEFDPLVPTPGNDVLLPEVLPVTASFAVGVDNGGVNVVSATYAYGMVGVYQVEFQVPQNAPPNNNAPFAIVVYQGTNSIYGNGSLIPIQ